ncbi:sarcosine oxidase subunit gamma [Rhizobiaceae bacterium]|nr:sarcosine oxidase subunit gamma [Rhizobiaceae bacterium]
MAKIATKAVRNLPNEGHDFAATGAAIAPCPPATRIVLRGDPKGYDKTLGFSLPSSIGQSNAKAGVHALMLGPDEWMILDTKRADAALIPKPSSALHATDVSHRNTGWTITGPLAAEALAVGCPRDLRLAAFPVNACARSIFGKTEVLLLRTGKTSFRMECWRSFAPYAFALLKDGVRDAAL